MKKKSLKNLTLGVITDIHHFFNDESLYSKESYVREIDVWSRILGKTVIAGGQGQGPMPNHIKAYADKEIEYIPIYHVPGSSWINRFKRFANIPSIGLSVLKLINKCDVIHLRTPSFSCLIAMFMLLFSKKPRIAKWAGAFEPFNGEPITSKLQRFFLKSGWLKGPVMVYGEYTEQHLISYFPATITEHELKIMKEASTHRNFTPPWQIIMVGRMVDTKGFDLGLKALAYLKKSRPELSWQAVLIGEGSYIETLRDLSEELDIMTNVNFVGGKRFKELIEYYCKAHVLLMPGQKEGFSKVLIESCASGTICVATDVGLSPWILDYGKRGFIAKPDPGDLGDALAKALTMSLDERKVMAGEGKKWASGITLEKFEEKLRKTLITYCSKML